MGKNKNEDGREEEGGLPIWNNNYNRPFSLLGFVFPKQIM